MTEKDNKDLDIFDIEFEDKNDSSSDFSSIEDIENSKFLIEDEQKPSILKLMTKFLLTFWLIFVLLMVAMNFPAYFKIAKAKIYADDANIMKANLLEASSNLKVEKKENKNEIIEDKNEKKEAQINKNKTFHSMEKLIAKKVETPLEINFVPYENRIVIPKIWKNIPLIDIKNQKAKDEKELENIFMQELEDWVVRYPWSAKPWEEWNAFIFGHSSNAIWAEGDYNDVFARLDDVVYNDEVIVYYGQKKHTYKIRKKKVVHPWAVWIIKDKPGESQITIMTCWPVWTTKNRLIIVWDLVSKW